MVSLTRSLSLKSIKRLGFDIRRGDQSLLTKQKLEGGVPSPEFTMAIHFENVAIFGVLKQGTRRNGNKVASINLSILTFSKCAVIG